MERKRLKLKLELKNARRSVQVGTKEARVEARAEELKRKLELTMQQKLRRPQLKWNCCRSDVVLMLELNLG